MRRLGLYPVWRLLALAWWKWARHNLQQVNPHHEDMGLICRRIADLERQR